MTFKFSQDFTKYGDKAIQKKNIYTDNETEDH